MRLSHEIRALLVLALPVTLSQFAQYALALVNTAVIGRVSALALATAAYATAIYYLFFMVLQGTLLAVAPHVAQAHAAGNRAGVARALVNGLKLAALLALVATPLLWTAAHLLQSFSPPGIDAPLAAAYLRVYSLAMLPVLSFSVLRGTMEALGRPRTVLMVAVLGVLAATLLSPALAFGYLGLPALGLIGAGYATVIIAWLTALTLALLSARTLRGYGVRRHLRPFDRSFLLELFKLGAPIGLTLGAEGGMFSTTALLMGNFGGEALAAHSVAIQTVTAVFMVPLGLSIATSIRVAQAAGRGNLRGARQAGVAGLLLSAAVMIGVASLYLFSPTLPIRAFIDVGDPSNMRVVSVAATFLGIAALFQLFDGVQVTANAALRGLKDTRGPMVISLASYWVVGVGSGVALAFGTELQGRGLWLGLVAGLAVAAALLLRRFVRLTATAWRHGRATGDERD